MKNVHAKSGAQEVSLASPGFVGEGQHPDRMPGHWVLARADKRVLRPGGLELTRRMLDALAIGPQDRVVEFAPGLGVTARMVLQRHPLAYWGVEREPAAVEYLRQQLAGTPAEIVLAQAEESGLPRSSATVVYGEAMLSMQSQERKNRIFAEARRLLEAGGRYGIQELCLLPDSIPDRLRHEIQAAMSKDIHVGVQPLSRSEWVRLFERNGLKVTWSSEAPMHLLKPWRVLQDEGLRGGLRFAFKMATDRTIRRRIFAMRRLFHKYGEHLGAISLVGRRESDVPISDHHQGTEGSGLGRVPEGRDK
jgi:SAM-dependent methyltransferase